MFLFLKFSFPTNKTQVFNKISLMENWLIIHMINSRPHPCVILVVYLSILIPYKGNMHFDTYFCFCFSLIFRIFPRAAALFLTIFFFLLFFNLMSWRQKYQIKYNRKLLCVILQKCQISLMKDIVKFLMIAAFAPNCSYLSYVFLQVGKIKVTAKQGLKILWIHCQNSALIMTNAIRKVRLRVDIFNNKNS